MQKMQSLLKLIGLLADLIQVLINRQAIARRDDEVQAIRNDPAGQFAAEFGGVPVKPTEAPMPGDKAGAQVDQEEWRWRDKH